MDIPYNTISKIIGGSNAPAKETPDAAAKEYDSISAETAPAVEHAHVKEQHKEEVEKVVEKERHQDHYHTTVQPLKEKEVLPEEHEFKQGQTEERAISHEDAAATREKLEAEKAQFASSTETEHSESKTVLPTKEGQEHVHHHLHETIQPVIEKEVVKPSTTHTTVKIHETHQDASVVHGTDVAAPMSVDEFKKAGNTIEKDL